MIHDVPPGVFVGEMAGSVLDSGGGRDELKTQFMTREGTYHLMTLAGTITKCLRFPNLHLLVSFQNTPGLTELGMPTRQPAATPLSRLVSHFPRLHSHFRLQVSFVNGGTGENGGEKIAFNYGRELFVYPYRFNALIYCSRWSPGLQMKMKQTRVRRELPNII